MRLAKIFLSIFFIYQASAAENGRPYLISSVEEFKDVQKHALDCLNSPAVKAVFGFRFSSVYRYYSAFETDITAEKLNSSVHQVALQKSYLAYRKLYKHCSAGRYALIGPKPIAAGGHNENSRILGADAADRIELQSIAKTNSRILRFGNALYRRNPQCPGKGGKRGEVNPVFLMISEANRKRATAEAESMLQEKLRSFGIASPNGLTKQGHIRDGVTQISDLDNPWNDWKAVAYVNEPGITKEFAGKKYFTPSAIVKMHELHHIAQTLPGEVDLKDVPPEREAVDELGCVIQQIVQMDEIHKKINSLPIESEVAYPADYPNGMKTGALANYFRPLLVKYPSVEKAITSKEGLEFMARHFPENQSCESQPAGKAPARKRKKAYSHEDEALDSSDEIEKSPISDPAR